TSGEERDAGPRRARSGRERCAGVKAVWPDATGNSSPRRGTLLDMRTPQRALALGAVLLLAAMVACAPSAGSEQRVEVQQLSEPTTYYPFQTGAAWQYLPEGARLSDPRA